MSHSGAHKQSAELLCQDLEAAGCSVFFDRGSDSAAKEAEVKTHRSCPQIPSLAGLAQNCRIIIIFEKSQFGKTNFNLYYFD